MTRVTQLSQLAAAAEAHGEAAMANGNDPVATIMFRVQEAADALMLAMQDAEAAGLMDVLVPVDVVAVENW